MAGIVIETIGPECPVFNARCVGPAQCDPTCPYAPARYRRPAHRRQRGGDRRTPEQVARAAARKRYIQAMLEAGMTQTAIARVLGISRQRVSQLAAEL